MRTHRIKTKKTQTVKKSADFNQTMQMSTASTLSKRHKNNNNNNKNTNKERNGEEKKRKKRQKKTTIRKRKKVTTFALIPLTAMARLMAALLRFLLTLLLPSFCLWWLRLFDLLSVCRAYMYRLSLTKLVHLVFGNVY